MGESIQELSTRYQAVGTSHICDALERVGVLTPVLSDRFRPVTTATKFAGPAVTLKYSRSRTADQPRRLNEFLDEQITEGSIVVIDAQGLLDVSSWGSRAGFTAQRAGAKGVLVHGGARDLEGLEELGVPVRTIGHAMRHSEGRYQCAGMNESLVLDGVLINPGDWLVADNTGVCVVPKESVVEVLELAEEREAIDNESFVGLRAGKSIREVHRHFHDDDVEEIAHLE